MEVRPCTAVLARQRTASGGGRLFFPFPADRRASPPHDLQGKDLTRVALPVTIFAPESFLERITSYWTFAPIFLQKAAAEKDAVERFKHVIAFAVAGLPFTTTQRKPFNSTLGETHEAMFTDGSMLYLEQICHHPPISQWQMDGPKDAYKYYGQCLFHASFRGNVIKGQQKGPNVVEFPDGTKITWQLPAIKISGVMWGARVVNFEGSIMFKDEKNNLACELQFNPDAQGFLKSMFSRSKAPAADTVRGDVFSFDPAAKPNKKGKLEPTAVHCTAEGSWISSLKFGDETVWDINVTETFKSVPVDDPLPSDSRFREDLIALKEGDLDRAQELKELIESTRRYEARLRSEAKKEEKKMAKKAPKTADVPAGKMLEA